MESTPKKPEVLVIVGETASGKSALAMRLAEKYNGEIISADSWTVYKGFDIGTSKPSNEDRRKVEHHLLDVVEPGESFSAPKFKKMAQAAINDIHSRKKMPIVVGGTGLYIDSLVFDYTFLPRASIEERSRLSSQNLSQLIDEAKTRNINLESIDTRNKRRIIRAIEAGGQRPKKSSLREGFLLVGVKMDKEELRRKIEQRVEQMINIGLVEEVKKLSSIHGWSVEPMKGIGYGEFRSYFEGEESLERVKERIISNTVNLAKRQRTWFKRNPSIHWFSSGPDAYKFVSSILNT